MEFDVESVREIVLSVAVVGLFVALIIFIGATYEPFVGAAGLALVATIALFILCMGLIGIYLARKSEDEA